MDKSNWPKAWKDQYNNVIIRRRELLKLRQKRDEYIDHSLFPQIWDAECDEESVFSFLGYNFPLQDVLSKLLQKFITPEKKDNLRLSGAYLFHTKKIFPGYFSDRERIVVILNRFKEVKNFEELDYWLEFESKQRIHPYTNLLLGILYLNEFLCNLEEEKWLHKAIFQLEKTIPMIKQESALLTLNSVLAFSYYMSNEFDKSVSYLGPKGDDFKRDFTDLIKKVAA